jgi:hypothetical protein
MKRANSTKSVREYSVCLINDEGIKKRSEEDEMSMERELFLLGGDWLIWGSKSQAEDAALLFRRKEELERLRLTETRECVCTVTL